MRVPRLAGLALLLLLASLSTDAIPQMQLAPGNRRSPGEEGKVVRPRMIDEMLGERPVAASPPPPSPSPPAPSSTAPPAEGAEDAPSKTKARPGSGDLSLPPPPRAIPGGGPAGSPWGGAPRFPGGGGVMGGPQYNPQNYPFRLDPPRAMSYSGGSSASNSPLLSILAALIAAALLAPLPL